MKTKKMMKKESLNMSGFVASKPRAAAAAPALEAGQTISQREDAICESYGFNPNALKLEAFQLRTELYTKELCKELLKEVAASLVSFSHWVDEMDTCAIQEANKAIVEWHEANQERRKEFRRRLERFGFSKKDIKDALLRDIQDELEEEDSRWHFAYKAAFCALQGEDMDNGWREFVLLHWTKKAWTRGRNNPMAIKNYLLSNAKRMAKEMGLQYMELRGTLTNSEVRRLYNIVRK